MSDLIRKPLTVALAAVLVFSACVPVPSGVGAYDRLRFERAEATPAVVLAVPVILATAAAAYGVYVTGTSVAEYNTNVQALYDGYSNASTYWSSSWAQYCQEKGGFDNAMQSCVTEDGNISLQTLTDAGFWDGLQSYSAYCVNNGTAKASASSSVNGTLTLGAASMTVGIPESDLVSAGIPLTNSNGYPIVAVNHVTTTQYGDYIGYRVYYGRLDTITATVTSSSSTKVLLRNVSQGVLYKANGTTEQLSANNSNYWPMSVNPNIGYYGYLNPDSSIVSNGVVNRVKLAVSDAVVNNTAVTPVATVQAFEPTVEQLQVGYDNTAILEAINGQTGVISADLSGIAAGISGLSALLSPLAGIAANVQNIRDWWSSFATSTTTPLPWYQSLWNSLLGVLGNTPIATLLSPISSGVAAIQTWLGDTPFGDVMGDLLDGVLGIPDAVAQGAADVCGVLDGVLDASLGLAGDIADALGLDALVDSILSPLVGVYEAVTGKDGTPSFFTDNVTLGLPTGFDDGLRLRLEDKVPFCYVIRSYTAIGQMFGNFSGNRSFYLDLDIPNAGTVRMDGEIVLSQRMGTLDIATTIRILATSLLCLGLLYRAYKVVERGTGGF